MKIDWPQLKYYSKNEMSIIKKNGNLKFRFPRSHLFFSSIVSFQCHEFKKKTIITFLYIYIYICFMCSIHFKVNTRFLIISPIIIE